MFLFLSVDGTNFLDKKLTGISISGSDPVPNC